MISQTVFRRIAQNAQNACTHALLFGLFLVTLICPLFQGVASAATPTPENGLLITPLRQYLAVDAGKDLQSSFSIANLTKQPLAVNLSYEQFSVTDYVYNYKFEAPTNKWLHLSTTSITLQPNQTQSISYTFQIPTGTAPGGYYYTLFASANLSSQGLNDTIQATDLVYLTVNGALTRVSHLQGSSIHWIVFGNSIPFNLQPINTGNVYSFVYVSGQLHGLFVKPPQTSTGHLLMPGKVRALTGSIPSPVLPGLYRAVYGYKTDSSWVIQQSHLVLFIPPWFVAFVLAAMLFAGKFLPRFKRPKTPTDDTPDA